MASVRIATVLVFLLTVSAVASAASANNRSNDLDTSGDINALAVAKNSGRILAATQDPYTGALGDENADVWYVWDSRGELVMAGHADHVDCGTQDRPNDNCVSHAVSGALDSDGDRVVVGSNIPDAFGDDYLGQILFILPDKGVVGDRKQYEGTIEDVAISDNGGKVAVLVRIPDPSVGSDDESEIHVYSWTGGGALSITELYSDTLTDQVPSDIDISPDGSVVVVAAEDYFRYKGSDTPAINTGVGSTLNVVDAGATSEHWVVAGYESGEVALFSDEAPTVPEFVRRPSTDSIQAVSIDVARGAYVGGDDSGKVYMFALDPDATGIKGSYLTSFSAASSGIDELYLSGGLLTYRAGTTVGMESLTGESHKSLWSATVPSDPTGLGATADGDLVAVAFADKVRIFDADHEVTASTPAGVNIKPGADRDVDFTLTNTGNRPETLDLAAGFPNGWSAVPDESTLSLDPGDTATVTVHIVVPAHQAPGTYDISLNYTLASGGEDSGSVTVTVPSVSDIVLVEPVSTSTGIDPGGNVVFQFTVHNGGNVAETVTLTQTVTPAGWTATLGSTSVTVNPGADVTDTLTLKAPSGAAKGETGTAVVGVQGDATQEISLYATVGAQFGVEIVGPAGTEVEPGERKEVDLTIHNTGNAPDSYRITVDPSSAPSGWNIRFTNGLATVTVDDVASGAEDSAKLLISAPVDAEADSTVLLEVDAVSLGDAGKRDGMSFVITVAAPEVQPTETGGDSQQSPAPIVFVILGIAVVALRRHRS